MGVTPRLVPGKDGVFDVRAGDQLVFSKHATGRFPEHAEVLEALKPLAGR